MDTARRIGRGIRIRRLAGLFVLSAAFHGLLLSGFALTVPTGMFSAGPVTHDVRLAPSFPVIRPEPSRRTPQIDAPRVILAGAEPRMTGRSDPGGAEPASVDLFGPVFSDGLWPRPLLVRTVPCDPADHERSDSAEACRRELRLIGLASDAAAGANAPP